MAHSDEAVELEVLKAEEFGREATVIKTKSKKIAAALEKVPPKLARLASVFDHEIGSRPAHERTPEHWRKVGNCARNVRKWMQGTFNISKAAHVAA